MNWGELLRIYTMIAGVSAVSLFVFASQFSDVLLSVAVVAVGTVALASVILGALVAGEAYLDETSTDRASDGRESTEAGIE